MAFADQLSGYNFLTGADNPFGQGNDLYLTLDARLNYEAYQALDGRRGAVGVYNYETGEILCMVSTPTFDPADPPDIQEGDERYEGVYVNPLPVQHLHPRLGVQDGHPDGGHREPARPVWAHLHPAPAPPWWGARPSPCPSAHGTMDIGGAFANSCNGVFAQLAAELGADTMSKYVEQAGLLDRYSVDGHPDRPGEL